LPEPLQLLSSWNTRQLESCLHDTQVSLDESVGHPIHVHNANAAMLSRCDFAGAVQRLSHWAPLDYDTEFITTASDLKRRVYDVPKDRFVYPWIELNARFGFVPLISSVKESPSSPKALPIHSRQRNGKSMSWTNKQGFAIPWLEESHRTPNFL